MDNSFGKEIIFGKMNCKLHLKEVGVFLGEDRVINTFITVVDNVEIFKKLSKSKTY